MNMIDSIISFFFKLSDEFTWPRLSILVAVMVMLIATVWLYESRTNHFLLKRFEREVALLAQMEELAAKGTFDKEKELVREGLNNVLVEFNSRYDEGSSDLSISFSGLPEWAEKAFYSLLPWAILSVLMLFSMGGGKGAAIAGVLMVAFPLAIIAVNLPMYDYKWINQWLYPWSSAAVVVAAILWWNKTKKSA